MYINQNHGTSVFFNNYAAANEQELLENLIIESIKQKGMDLYYLPRNLKSFDSIYGEDDTSEFNRAFPIEMYLKSVDGFSGDGVFLSKFGLEIRDQVTFVMARRIFTQEVGRYASIARPNEGDIIYFPLNKKCFEIKYVNYKEFFYQLGKLYTYEVTCELFEYTNERFNTGIPEIDEIQTKFSTNVLDYTILDQEGNYLVDENGNYIADTRYLIKDIDLGTNNEDIQTEQTENNYLDWSESNPFSQGNY